MKHFTGISDPYEEPINPEIICLTDRFTVEQCVNQVLHYLQSQGLISAFNKSKIYTISQKY
ncbi:adenylyl-sulfate kinase [Dendronalium sp. ChiSLP03b]|uniref:adenylyl-sulfate kinase n=1 Tax=Dendronalium sp. ChiSLP03b TaxID=3075381 RepID=UPI002AD1FF9F|nr:adenylyl-sulfate kinase [Dendronalium sp. ChiSLP03b]MDZ8207983.1 adenylyl-sulfate kinase [Dendronalium sp. ChiSLP03b]